METPVVVAIIGGLLRPFCAIPRPTGTPGIAGGGATGSHAVAGPGQTIRVEGMNFYRLRDGRVTDIWTQFDGVALMQQLGAIPA